ncbi:MAG: hypothetical protein AAF431_15150 [Pseudomonadota bacterium]
MMQIFKPVIPSLLLVLVGITFLVGCSAIDESTPLAVVVEVPRPAGLNNEQLINEFERAVPLYATIQGLTRKYFVYNDEAFGGVYLWQSRAAAEAFFNQAWHSRIEQQYGQAATLRYFAAPVVTPGSNAANVSRENIVAIVNVTAPWYAPEPMIVSRMQDAIPLYANQGGLIHKYFTITDSRKVGGIYLWQDQQSADNFYNQSWRDRILDSYGEAAELEFLNAPVLMTKNTNSQ